MVRFAVVLGVLGSISLVGLFVGQVSHLLGPEPSMTIESLPLSSATVTVSDTSAHKRSVDTPRVQTVCGSCHDASAGYVETTDHFLNQRALLSEKSWADSIALQAKCGSCHQTPKPALIPTERWGEVVAHMNRVTFNFEQAPTFRPAPSHKQPYEQWVQETWDQWEDVLHYYLVNSDSAQTLPPDPPVQKRQFKDYLIGRPMNNGTDPKIGNINVVDLNRDGTQDLLVCDLNKNTINWVYPGESEWEELTVGTASAPGRTEVVDINQDGLLDIVVADLGRISPTDERLGGVHLLINKGQMQFKRRTILNKMPRVSDVRPADFDGDGDVDFVVAAFGFMEEGEIGWLEQTQTGTFSYHKVSDKAGAIHVPVVDINKDGKKDFVALIAQHHEEVSAFINQDGGGFKPRQLFKAKTPSFGSSGIEMVDLDRDGDLDILYTNGDAFDLPGGPMILPYHGIQWLENRGGNFVYHDILRFYGAYRAVAGDIDRDNDLDIAAVSMINDWADTTRKSVIWLENDGNQQFTPHGVSNTPTHMMTAALADLDKDGFLDLVTGNMHFFYETEEARKARLLFWHNLEN